ncbi:MAG: hypothetical protein Q7L55_00215 [Actinomycetota bacterium]|nr:hypothetical protein [Actinomycetota bacterium]
MSPPSGPGPTLSVPGLAGRRKLRDAITFSLQDLGQLLGSDAIPAVRFLSAQAVDFEQLDDHSKLCLPLRFPFVAREDGLFLLSPGSMAESLIHHMVLLAASEGCLDLLQERMHYESERNARRCLHSMGARQVGDGAVVVEGCVTASQFMLDDHLLTDLVVVTPRLETDSLFDPEANIDCSVLESSIEAWLTQRQSSRVPMTILAVEWMNRYGFFGLADGGQLEAQLVLTLEELDVLSCLLQHDPRRFWHFAQADQRLSETAHVISFSALARFGMFSDFDDTFYLGDGSAPTAVFVQGDYALPLRARLGNARDRHLVEDPSRSTYVSIAKLHPGDWPIYVTDAGAGRVALVLELSSLNVWFPIDTDTPQEVWTIEFHIKEALAYWLWQISLVEPALLAFLDNEAHAVEIAVSLGDPDEWLTLDSEEEPPGDPVNWMSIEGADSGKFHASFSPLGKFLLLRGGNEADRQMVESLLGLLAAELAEQVRQAVLERIAPVGPKRMLHAWSLKEGPHPPEDLMRPRRVAPAATDQQLESLVPWLAERYPPGPIPPSERTTVLNQVVMFYSDRLAEELDQFDAMDLVEKLLKNNEALIFGRLGDWRLLPSSVACFGADSGRVEELVVDMREYATAGVCGRFLVERITARPSAGTRIASTDDFDRLMAIAREIFSRGSLSDAIHSGLSQVDISVLPSGRLGVGRNDRFARSHDERAHALAQELMYEDNFGDALGNTPRPSQMDELDNAYAAEFCFSASELAGGLGVLLDIGIEGADSGVSRRLESEVRMELSSRLGWSSLTSDAFFDRLTLQVQTMPDTARANGPWRYNRDRSLARRPIAQLCDPDGREVLLWGLRSIYDSAGFLYQLIVTGRYQATSPEMQQLMGRLANTESRDLEGRIATLITVSTGAEARVRVRRVDGRLLVGPNGQELGDIDVLAALADRKIVLVCEAKGLNTGRTPAELAHEVDSLLVGDDAAVPRIESRAKWLRSHLSSTLSHLGIAGSSSGWRVVPVVVTSDELIAPRIVDSNTPIIPLGDLDSWLLEL